VTAPSATAVRLMKADSLRRLPLPLLPLLRLRNAEAPIELSYRDWARERIGPVAAENAIGFASLPTFHADPGQLSAAFVHGRIQRSLVRNPVYYVLGGWQTLVDGLAKRALELGARIHTQSKLSELPDSPVIVATGLRAARRLLDDEQIDWPCARTALYDVALRSRRFDPGGVLDLDRRIYASRYNTRDPSLAPAGESLLQAVAGLGPDESRESGFARIESVLERAYPGFQGRVLWRRKAVSEDGAGPADPPGTSWRDRPAIDRGNGRWLVGDCTAAPGVLSEVAFASASQATAEVAEKIGL
jgi:phytoene dehydrogenase-like protein